MIITFLDMSVYGFRSIEEIENFEFNKLGLVKVVGRNNKDAKSESNGAGKSSLFEAILWALTGSTSKGSTEVENHNLNKGVYVRLRFVIDKNTYEIIRSKNHETYGTGLVFTKNDEDISGNTPTKTKQIIKDELGEIDSTVISNIIILSQGMPDRLSVLKPSSRKSVLENLSDTDYMINDIGKRLDNLSNMYNLKLSEVNQQIDNNKLKSYRLQESVNSDKKLIDNLKSLKDNTISEFEYGELKLTSIEVTTELDSKKKLVQEISNKILENVSNSNRLKPEIYNLENANKELHDKIISLVSDTPKCPTCHQSIQNEDTLRELLIGYKSQLANNIKSLDAYKEKLDRLQKEHDELVLDNKGYRNSVEKLQTQLRELTAKMSKYNPELKDVADKIEGYNKSIDDSLYAIDILNQNTEKLTKESDTYYKKLAMLKFLNNQSSRKFRTYLLTSVVSYLNSVCDKMSEYLFEKSKVHLEIDGNNLDIYLNDTKFEDLSGGEGRRVDIILQLALRELAQKRAGITSNILVLDEIFDNLDTLGGNNVIRLIEEQSYDISSIFLISHKNDFEINNDMTLVVSKDEQGNSHVSLRGG